MIIGNLHELIERIDFQLSFADSNLVPQTVAFGNPANGESLLIKWEAIRDTPVALHFTLSQPCFVDRAVVRLGEKTALTSATVSTCGQCLGQHTAETGKTITTKELQLEAGEVCTELTLTLCADFANLEVLSVEFHGALEDGLDLFPTPNSVTLGEQVFPFSRFTSYSCDCEDARSAARILSEKFSEKTNSSLTECSKGDIRFLTDSSIATDGYELNVALDGAVICASNFRGFVCGVETFIKLIRDDGIPAVKISDSPAMPIRGVHMFIPSADKMAFAKRLIKYLISPMGYNTVFLQVSGGMIYDSHPNISAAFENAVAMHAQGKCPAFPHSGVAEGKPITKDQLRAYIAYIRSFGIDVIPEVQSLGHVQYLTHAYPEIAEIDIEEEDAKIDTREEDLPPSKFYRHCYCPSNPRTYEILFDILDEIIDVFQPREYVHMGHDEVYLIGACRKCRQKTPAELFAYDVCKIHDYLAEKGLKMMIWSDMIQPVTKYLTPAAIDRIPKDILMLDFIWYFHLDKDIEENLLAKDFRMIYGNLYSSHFPRYESRIRKPGILGGQISAWVATSEYELQKEGKFYDLFLTAQMLWADSYRKLYVLTYDRMISAMMPSLRENLNNIRYPSRLDGATTQLLAANPTASTFSSDKVFAVNGSFDSLVFYHAALRNISRLPWSHLDVVGKYILHYEDETTEEIPITYSGNIGYIGRRQNAPILHKAYRHTGYVATYYTDSVTTHAANGDPVTLYRLEYLPKQKKPIKAVVLEEDPNFDAKLYLARLEGVNAP